ncbi:MAG: hypothetical protein ACTTIZ_09050, partial [Treponema sp.]
YSLHMRNCTCCGREYDRLSMNSLSSQRCKPLTCCGREYDRLQINFPLIASPSGLDMLQPRMRLQSNEFPLIAEA